MPVQTVNVCCFVLFQLVQNHERDLPPLWEAAPNGRDLENELDGMTINAVDDNGQVELFELIPYIGDGI